VLRATGAVEGRAVGLSEWVEFLPLPEGDPVVVGASRWSKMTSIEHVRPFGLGVISDAGHSDAE
jgi:hypothetical protein